MSSPITQTRALYRSLLRELPPLPTRTATSPLRASIRSHIASHTPPTPSAATARNHEIEQLVQYLKAQRMYVTLLERYNPGANMDEEERVRLSARRVGMEMPEEWYGKGKAGTFGIDFGGDKKK